MSTPTFAARPVRKGIWFPLSLAVLLLLTLPGLALLVLTLLGYEGLVNTWLRNRLHLTYNIPLPWWAALALLLVPLLIVLLYFLKMKRKPLQVPSTFLWRKSIEDLTVNSLFQWLRDNVLLLIQLLIILLLIYSVLSFQVHGGQTSGQHYILIVDNSASMSATDVSPNRLEIARQEALKEIDRHGNEDFGMVIAFNSRASILQPYTSDKGLLRSSVQRIGPTQRRTRIEEALTLADSLANPTRSTMNAAATPDNVEPGKERQVVDVALEAIPAEVHLFSDGGFSDGSAFAAGNLNLHYHRVGQPGPGADNLGIVTFNAVRDPQETSKVQAFVRILNFRTEPAETRLELQWQVLGQKDFKLKDQKVFLQGRTTAPGDPEKKEPAQDTPGEAVITFDLPDLEEETVVILEARLVGNKDAFPLDDRAWLVLGKTRKARVLIVTPGNEILHKFFDQEATQKLAQVTYLIPPELKDESKYGRPTQEGAFDLVVFDRCAPEAEAAMPQANTFFIGDVPPPWKRSELPPLTNVFIRNPTSKHPLMRHLTALDEIAFSEAFRFDFKDERVPPQVPRLLETDRETAVLFALPRASGRTDLVLAFPLVNSQGGWPSTWTLKLSFPLFLRNVLYQLGNVSDPTADESLAPGEVKVLRPDSTVHELFVQAPGAQVAEKVQRGSQAEFAYNNTEQVGVYAATWPGGEQVFAVDLLDLQESDIQPRDVVQIGAQELKGQASSGQPRDTWKWWALAALVGLVLEWVFYHRRFFR
jgi:hypothetical protein